MSMPRTNSDLLESGINPEKIKSLWRKALVEIEIAKRKTICRICGSEIKKGQERVVTEDPDLVFIYCAFWSMKVYAHKDCYKLILDGDEQA